MRKDGFCRRTIFMEVYIIRFELSFSNNAIENILKFLKPIDT